MSSRQISRITTTTTNQRIKRTTKRKLSDLDTRLKDVLPLIFARLDMKDQKNVRLSNNRFREVMDNKQYHKLLNLVFGISLSFDTSEKMIKQHPWNVQQKI